MCHDCNITPVPHDGPSPHSSATGEDSPFASARIMARAGREAVERGCPIVEAIAAPTCPRCTRLLTADDEPGYACGVCRGYRYP